jgi:hypothetical protein
MYGLMPFPRCNPAPNNAYDVLRPFFILVANETAKDKVTINSSKSAVIIYNANKQREKQEWKLGENKIEEVDSTTHIDIFFFSMTVVLGVAPRSTYIASVAHLSGRP